jgi:orotate phosphoribosyltransferase
MSVAHKIAEILLDAKAVKLSPDAPFTWSSGWKSPIYCDNRVVLSYPEKRKFIKEALAELIKNKFPEATAIAGVATAGIPQGALVADELNLSFAYVRPKPKDHGMGNQIEGRLETTDKVVVIEDLISTGGSSLKAAEALQKAGIEVLGMVSIFTYGFELAEENFKNANIPLVCLSNYNTLIEVAQTKNVVSASQIDSLNAWRVSPSTWGV